MLIDTHCHLDIKAYGSWEAIDEVVQRAHEHGVAKMVSIGSGYGAESAERVMHLIKRQKTVYGTVGIHPHDASCWTQEIEDALRFWAESPKVLALGEMGLDFHYNMSPPEKQREAFTAQVRLAHECQLPVVIHDRDSDGEVYEILSAHKGFDVGVLYHCFCGTVEEMENIVAAGGYISIPGIVTFKNAGQMREVVKEVPIDRLLIETDSPFLTPVPFRGKQNEPQFVRLVAEKIATIKGMSVEEVAANTTQNATRFFGL